MIPRLVERRESILFWDLITTEIILVSVLIYLGSIVSMTTSDSSSNLIVLRQTDQTLRAISKEWSIHFVMCWQRCRWSSLYRRFLNSLVRKQSSRQSHLFNFQLNKQQNRQKLKHQARIKLSSIPTISLSNKLTMFCCRNSHNAKKEYFHRNLKPKTKPEEHCHHQNYKKQYHLQTTHIRKRNCK